MNPKAIACILLGMIVALAGYVTMTVYEKLSAAQKEEEKSELAFNEAKNAVSRKARDVSLKGKETEYAREYLKIWEHYLEETRTDTDCIRKMDERVKAAGLTALEQEGKPVGNQNGSSIPLIYQAKYLFVSDFHKTLKWLGDVENRLPSSRINTIQITKGGSGSDVRSNVTVDLPMYAGN